MFGITDRAVKSKYQKWKAGVPLSSRVRPDPDALAEASLMLANGARQAEVGTSTGMSKTRISVNCGRRTAREPSQQWQVEYPKCFRIIGEEVPAVDLHVEPNLPDADRKLQEQHWIAHGSWTFCSTCDSW